MKQSTTPSASAGALPSAVLCLLFGLVAPLAAQPPESGAPPESDAQTLVLERGASQVRLAFPSVEIEGVAGDDLEAAREIEQTLRDDLEQDFLFNVQGPTELSVLTLSGVRDQDFEQYRSLGNEVVLLATLRKEDDKIVLDGWTYDLPSRQSVLGKRFRGSRGQARLVAHYMADALHYQFSARPSIFLTTIAFQSNRSGFQELYLMDYDGHNQRRISGHKSTSGYSDWSPGGDAIAYMSYFSGTPGIYYVDLASGNKVPVYVEPPLSLSPSFAPDGRRIAFAHSRGANTDIYVCERDCRNPRAVTSSGAIDTNPSWSPDGRQLAFTSGRSGQPQIYVMDADGANVRRISFEGDYNDGATWRPDGTHLAYASRADRRRFQIALTSLVDLTTRLLSSGPDSYEEPSFSPDGQKIVFTVKRGVESQIFTMNAEGGNWRQLTHEGSNTGGDWSGFPRK
jgi:TolB protein